MAANITTICLLYAPTMCAHATSILVGRSSGNGSISPSLRSFSRFKLFRSDAGMGGRLVAFRSPTLVARMIGQFHLSVGCFIPKGFRHRITCKLALPISMAVDSFPRGRSTKFALRMRPSDALLLSSFAHGKARLSKGSVGNHLLSSVAAPLKGVVVRTAPGCIGNRACALCMNGSDLCSTMGSYSSGLSISLGGRGTSIVSLSFESGSMRQTRSMLDVLVSICGRG